MARDRLPETMTALFKRHDFHIHSNLSSCAVAQMTVPAIVERMAELEFEQIGIADHVYSPQAIRDVAIKAAAISARRPSLAVFVGVELCMVRPGVLAMPLAALKQADYVMTATTHYGVPWVDSPAMDSAAGVASYILDMLESASEMAEIDVIAHPLFVPSLVGRSQPFDNHAHMMELLDKDRLKRIVAKLHRNRIAVEISPRAMPDAVRPALLTFYRLCRETGVKFSFGSDAHRPEVMGMTRGLVPLVEALELEDEHIWTPGAGKAC